MILHILAQTTTAPATPSSSFNWPTPPASFPGQGDLLTWAQNMGPASAAMLIIAGIIYLAFGVHIYRVLVTLNAAAFGVYIGGLIGARAGNVVAGALVGGFAAAAITWPLMKYAVAVMGGVFGGLLGASLWKSVGLEPNYAWAGAMTGLAFMGMFAFVLFRGSIMMYTSLQGSVMLVFGLLGLIYKYQGIAPAVTEGLSLQPFILPICIFIPTLIGLIYQQTQYPGTPAVPGGKK